VTTQGLKGEYHIGRDIIQQGLNGRAEHTRIDPRIDFEWKDGDKLGKYWYKGEGEAIRTKPSEKFSIRWTGKLLTPPTKGTYTFKADIDDKARLKIGNQQVFECLGYGEAQGTIELEPNCLYDFELVYYQSVGPARIKLRWSYPGLEKEEMLPSNMLFPMIAEKTPYQNLALKKPAIASSFWPGYSASNANDDNALGDNGWASAPAVHLTSDPDPSSTWWQVDLGTPCQIDKIELVTRQSRNDPFNRRNFEIRASNDPTMKAYVVLGQEDDSIPFQGTWTGPVKEAGQFRYIRAAKTKKEKDVEHEFFITELRVWGMEVVAPTTNLAEKKPAIASSFWDSSYSASKANDGDATGNNGWSSAPYGYFTSNPDPSSTWWQVDLGAAPCQIDKIELVTRQNADQPFNRRNFEILASNDPTMKEYVVLGRSEGDSILYQGTWTHPVKEAGQFRYIRATKTKKEIGEQEFFIAELRVFGYQL
jgi:hypothetical protein